MKFIITAIYLVGMIGPAIYQTSTPPVQASISEQIRIDSFQSSRRGDNYGIASFVLSNNTDKPLTSIELNCWVNDDRARGTKVLVWPSAGPIRAHDQEKFSNVNIGLVGPNPRAACDVTKAE